MRKKPQRRTREPCHEAAATHTHTHTSPLVRSFGSERHRPGRAFLSSRRLCRLGPARLCEGRAWLVAVSLNSRNTRKDPGHMPPTPSEPADTHRREEQAERWPIRAASKQCHGTLHREKELIIFTHAHTADGREGCKPCMPVFPPCPLHAATRKEPCSISRCDGDDDTIFCRPFNEAWARAITAPPTSSNRLEINASGRSNRRRSLYRKSCDRRPRATRPCMTRYRIGQLVLANPTPPRTDQSQNAAGTLLARNKYAAGTVPRPNRGQSCQRWDDGGAANTKANNRRSTRPHCKLERTKFEACGKQRGMPERKSAPC